MASVNLSPASPLTISQLLNFLLMFFEEEVKRRKMFGGLAFMVRGKMTVTVSSKGSKSLTDVMDGFLTSDGKRKARLRISMILNQVTEVDFWLLVEEPHYYFGLQQNTSFHSSRL